ATSLTFLPASRRSRDTSSELGRIALRHDRCSIAKRDQSLPTRLHETGDGSVSTKPGQHQTPIRYPDNSIAPISVSASRRVPIARSGAVLGLPRRHGSSLSGCAGDKCGDDVGGMSVERDWSAVVTHRGAWVSVTRGFLNVAKRDAGVERGGDKCVTKCVWSH